MVILNATQFTGLPGANVWNLREIIVSHVSHDSYKPFWKFAVNNRFINNHRHEKERQLVIEQKQNRG